ncbi:MAG: PspC domain-containing protein [bacterium]|nr:PspC domain-containing protein [bacterium]
MESTQQPTQPQTPRPRLERLRQDRAVAGVASGLARYLNVDVAWVRIAFVVTALIGGSGVLLYLVGWVAMPEEGESESIVSDKARRFPDAGSWIGVGLIVIAAMIIIGNTGLIDGDLVFAAVLIVLGFLLYRGDIPGFSGSDESTDGPEQPLDTASLAGEEVTADAVVASDDSLVYGRQVDQPAPPPVAPTPPQPPDPAFQPRPVEPRQSSVLGRLALATLLIVVGIMGVGHSSGWWEPAIRHYVGTGFVILGVALVIGSIFGRARWLIAVGLISAPLLFGAALLDVPLEGGFGDPHFTPQSAAELEADYRLIAGELLIDLSELDLAAGEVYEIEASVVFGSLQVQVPEGLGVEVTAELDAGEIRFNGESVAQGMSKDRSIVYEGEGLIVLDAHVGFGELVVDLMEETP